MENNFFEDNNFPRNNIKIVNDLDGLLYKIEKYYLHYNINRNVKGDKYVFRGISRYNEFYNSFARKFDTTSQDKYFCENCEIKMLHKLEQNGSQYFNNISNVFDFVSTAQHFGIPTRMLDWTYNPFAALLFSMFENKNPDGDYYMLLLVKLDSQIKLYDLPIMPDSNNDFVTKKNLSIKFLSMIQTIKKLYSDSTSDDEIKNIILQLLSNTNPRFFTDIYVNHKPTKEINNLVDRIFHKIRQKKIIFIKPNYSNPRIAAQQGILQFSYTLDKNALIKQMAENVTVIKIPKIGIINKSKLVDSRMFIIKRLEEMGYNIFNLIPDLSNVCRGIFIKMRDGFYTKGKK